MRPVLLALGPFRLYGYGAAVALGGVVAARFLWGRRRKAGLPDEESYWALINVAVVSGFVGGKLLYLVQYGAADLSLMTGYSSFGGFLCIPLAIAAFARWKKIPLLKLADYMFLSALLWHAFGRLGCFLAGCCYGKPTGLPWGLAFQDAASMLPPELLGVRLHPVQLYESAGDLVIAAILYRVLLAIEAGKLKPGLVAAGHFAAYGVLRFALEFVRGDALPFSGPFSQGQAFGAGLLAAATGIMIMRSRCSPSC